LEAAAARAAGQPATFVRLLRGERRVGPALRVAEARPEYRVLPASAEPPLASDVVHWVRRGEDAVRLASRGRHAAARRTLVECSAALRRRGQIALAAACDVRSGRLLLARGDATGAEGLFRRAYAELEDADDTNAQEAVLGIAASLVACGALEHAEALLRAARERNHDPRGSILLAECLCVQARYEQAERAIGPVLDHDDPLSRAAALRVIGEIALGRHAVADAGRAASMSLAEIDGREAPGLIAAAHELCVAVQGRVSHADAVRHHAAHGLAAARAARDRLGLLSLRAARLDALYRCGEPPTAREIARLDMVVNAPLPALVRTRLAAVLARVHPLEKRRSVLRDRVRAFVTASGARALDPDASAAPGTSLAQDAAALIQLASAEPDSQRLIETLCGRLRERLDATTVAMLDVEGRSVAWCGRPCSFVTPARVVVSRQPIPPWISDRGLETAVPVEYGSRLQGVLAARWTIAGQPPATTTSILVTAAACAAPALHLLNDQRRMEPVTVPANGIVGRSPAIVRLHDAIRRAGASPFPVLIEGESGVGKELAARALHAASPRRSRPFSAVNCASFQDDLFEAELFGHARGAFTGAHAERAGLFEQADGGTLFLDEISELTPRAQAKLLRALQEGEIRRLGENTARRVDVRVIAASNRALGDESKAGRFRQDLLFRVAVIKLAIAPLRERREDIPLLAATIWSQVAGHTGTRASLTSSAVAALSRHDWPGNVRELQNVIAALAVQVPRGRVEAADVNALLAADAAVAPEPATLEAARKRFERSFVAAALASSGGRQAEAARVLGITRQGLAKLMKRLSVPGDFTKSADRRKGA
jgi:DNA-binding NtrC family response regulator/tetratricopeptide (TPR) repeat protein